MRKTQVKETKNNTSNIFDKNGLYHTLKTLGIYFTGPLLIYLMEYLWPGKGGFKSITLLVTLILGFTQFIGFALFGYRDINQSITEPIEKNKPILIIKAVLMVFFLLTALTMDCMIIHKLNPDSYHFNEGFSHANPFIKFFNFFYFNVVTFATVGYGDITPVSVAAKILVIIEVMLNFFIIGFVLSAFSNANRPK